ncbi:MAG TPA: MFS transporter [Pilimelia sp.]|nr:MFS transporter [Pilimelia sp.]
MADPTPPAGPVRLRILFLVWFGQLASLIGSSLTGFVLGVWVYQRTGSVSQFAMIFLASTLPGILAAPFAGVLADRWDRRRLMLASDTGAALATGLVGLLVALDALQVWHIYLTTAAGSACAVVHQVSYAALTPGIVGKRHLARFNGLAQAGRAAQIAAPLLAGALIGLVGVGGVIALDLATFAIAVATLAAVRLPAGVTRPDRAGGDSSWRDAGAGWRYLRTRPGMPGLLVVFGAYNFLFALAGVLVQPLILSFSSPATLGGLMFAGGAGLLAGSLLMGAWGGPRRRIHAVYAGLAGGGVALSLHSLAPSPWLIAVTAPAFLFTLPIINAASLTLLQTKVPSAVLGRVMATARVIGEAAVPVAYLAAGPLADGVFEPLLRADGALAGSAGSIIGTGQGRGIALIFAVAGLAMLVLTGVALAQPRIRHIDDLPDAVDLPAAPAARAVPAARAGAGGARVRPAESSPPVHEGVA